MYSSGDDADSGALQSQKHHGVCRAYQPLIRTLLDFTSQPSAHTSLFYPCYSDSVNDGDVPAACRSLYFLCLSRQCQPMPKHGLTSSGRLLHCVCRVRCTSAGQSSTVSTKAPCSEQVQFIIKTSDLHFLWHLKAVFTKMYHLTY